jgi:hypothetical protein
MIKKRNLDPSLVQWIMTQTGLGPGIGEIFYVAPAASSTSQYRTQLQSMGIKDDRIYLSPDTAYAAMVAGRNDVMLIAPGIYDLDAELAWSKANTHMIGLGGPNTLGDFYEPNVCVYTDSTSVASVVTVTGQNCQFHNVNFFQYGNNAACLTAFTLTAYGCYLKNCAFMGATTAGTDNVVAAASLYIGASAGYPIFEDCTIGQNCWYAREGALSGVLRFTNTSSATLPYNGKFIRCRFLSISETATVAMVALPANSCIAGTWLFDNCSFENYSVNWAANLNQVFYDACGTSHGIVLHHCMALGIDEWQDADGGNNYIGSDMPIVGLGGGLARNPTAVTGS